MSITSDHIMKNGSASPHAGLSNLKHWWQARRERRRQRTQIARLGPLDFADMGTTRAQLEFELESPLMRKLRTWGG